MKTDYLKLSKTKQAVIVSFFLILKIVLLNCFGTKLFAYIEFFTFSFTYFVCWFFSLTSFRLNQFFLLINHHQTVGLFLMNVAVSFLFYTFNIIFF